MINKNGIILINVLALGLYGCGSSSSSSEPAVTPDDNMMSETADDNSMDTTDDTNTDATDDTTDATEDTTGDTTTTGPVSVNIGDNPGAVQSPVLADHTSLDAVELGGHKVYAGPTERFFEGYSYVNYTFDCDGTGSYELFPAAEFAAFANIELGTFDWSADEDDVRVEVTEQTQTGEDVEYDFLDFGLSSGALIVGETTFESKYVSHILQFEQCN